MDLGIVSYPAFKSCDDMGILRSGSFAILDNASAAQSRSGGLKATLRRYADGMADGMYASAGGVSNE